ncbi:MAG: SEL1-like repeat protein [Solobacterium sp.]|nr:SEL1-like repeat protein [Solobacterium sp.]
MNTNNENMTVIGPDELAVLEETAIDGSQDSARILYQYYLDPAHYDQEKASYWGSFLNEEPEAEEAAQTPAEGMSEAEQWMFDYNNGITEKMMIRQLQERAAEGDPFAPIVMADLYADESEQGILEKLRYFETAKNNAEKLNHVPGYNEVLYRLQLVMGDNHHNLAEDPHDAHAKEAFRHYVNAADMSASLHDNEAYSRLISCYQEGFGCEQDPAKAEEMHVRMYENSGAEGLLMLAKENQEQQKRLNAVDYLQRCLMSEEDYPDVMAAARFKLACMNMPADNGLIPDINETVQELTRTWTQGLQTFFMPEEAELFVNAVTENSDIETYADSDNPAFLMYLVEQLIGSRLHGYLIEDVYLDNYYVYDTDHSDRVMIAFEPEGERLRNTTGEMSYDEDYRICSEKILKLCLKAAELGEAQAMYAAGKLYAAHTVDEPDAYTAGDWILKASENGNPDALILMAQVYGQAGDLPAAASYLEQVLDNETVDADKKRLAAVNYAGVCVVDGKEANLQTALSYYQEADEQGDLLAPVMLGKMYCNGIGVPQDFVTARQYLQKGADNGIPQALIMLGDLYFEGLGGPADHAAAEKYYEEAGYGGEREGLRLLRLGIIRNEAGDPERGLQYFRQAADAGDTYALVEMAAMYRDGYGVSVDYARSIDLLNEAVEKGDLNAAVDLGMMYMNGAGVQQDLRTAYELFTRAAEENNPYGLNNLGYMYDYGLYVQKDERQAIELYQRAFDMGFSAAANRIGVLYMGTDQTARNVQEAVEWFEKGAEAGSIDAAKNLGRVYFNGDGVPRDVFKAIRCFERAADLGDTGAMQDLGVMYGNGDGVQRNLVKAFEWFKRGAEAGNTYCMCNLGNMYRNGDGTSRNYFLAKQWLEKGAQAGNPEAAYWLSKMYDYGEGMSVNYAEAIRYLRMAADAGHGFAINDLGAHYVNGTGVQTDVRAALELYERAAGLGIALSMRNMGNLYWRGELVPKDLDTALYWFEKASDAGVDASDEIQQIRQELAAKPKGFFKWFS